MNKKTISLPNVEKNIQSSKKVDAIVEAIDGSVQSLRQKFKIATTDKIRIVILDSINSELNFISLVIEETSKDFKNSGDTNRLKEVMEDLKSLQKAVWNECIHCGIYAQDVYNFRQLYAIDIALRIETLNSELTNLKNSIISQNNDQNSYRQNQQKVNEIVKEVLHTRKELEKVQVKTREAIADLPQKANNPDPKLAVHVDQKLLDSMEAANSKLTIARDETIKLEARAHETSVLINSLLIHSLSQREPVSVDNRRKNDPARIAFLITEEKQRMKAHLQAISALVTKAVDAEAAQQIKARLSYGELLWKKAHSTQSIPA